MKNLIILVASNCQVRYEIKLEAVIQLFGTGTETETLLILAAAQLHICGTLSQTAGRPNSPYFWYVTIDHTLTLCLPPQSCC